MFETALLSMLAEAGSEAFADFWIIIVRVSTLAAIFAIAIQGELLTLLRESLMRKFALTAIAADACRHEFFAFFQLFLGQQHFFKNLI